MYDPDRSPYGLAQGGFLLSVWYSYPTSFQSTLDTGIEKLLLCHLWMPRDGEKLAATELELSLLRRQLAGEQQRRRDFEQRGAAAAPSTRSSRGHACAEGLNEMGKVMRKS